MLKLLLLFKQVFGVREILKISQNVLNNVTTVRNITGH